MVKETFHCIITLSKNTMILTIFAYQWVPERIFLVLKHRILPQKTLSYTNTMAGERINNKNAIAQFPPFVLYKLT